MTHKQRIEAALAYKETDRLPYSIWMHHPNRDRSPRRLAELMFKMQQEMDLDFVKYMPFGLHSTIDWGLDMDVFPGFFEPPVPHAPVIAKADDWDKITPRKGTGGEYAVILESQRLFKALCREAAPKEEIPLVQTVFSPMTTALKLTTEAALIEHLRTNPGKVRRALEVITDTTVEYARAAVENGADGIFFATQMSTKKITAKEHADYVKAFDLPVLNVVKGASWFNILHIHGADTWFEDLLDYPVQALNWHDRDDGPGFAEARQVFEKQGAVSKAFVGGLGHLSALHKGTDAEVRAQVEDTWLKGTRRGAILAPGCVAATTTAPERLAFIRKCVEATAR
jgi:uroporphyrinogen decarboxylase